MKKIVKGNDFTLKIPVMKIVNGEKVAFPLPACTDMVVRVCSPYRRYELEYSIDAAEDNIILAKVEGDTLSLGTYAVEVRGKIYGNDWRSNEYPQFRIVNENADADTEFSEGDEGDNSVEMDTAIVFLPPEANLSTLISDAETLVSKADEAVTNAEKAVAKAEGAANVDVDLNGTDLEITTKTGEKKGFNLLLLKGADGKDGAAGAQGPAGPQGEKGEKGDKGDTGATGAQGPQGAAGAKGDKGDKGDTGAQGPQGEKGEKGDAGATGPQGAKGDTGATGAQGKDGAAGAKGDKGEKGDKGDALTYADLTSDQIAELQKPATDAASKVDGVIAEAEAQLKGLEVQSVGTDTLEMEAGKYYDIPLASTNTLTLTLQATTDTTHAHDYEGGFDTSTTAPTVTWPADVTWADMPTLKAAMHYEFSIREVGSKKYGVIYAWSKA